MKINKLNIIYYIWAILTIILYYVPISLTNSTKTLFSILGFIVAFLFHVAFEKEKEKKDKG